MCSGSEIPPGVTLKYRKGENLMDDFLHVFIEGISFVFAVTLFFFLLSAVTGTSELSNKNINTKTSITMNNGVEKDNSEIYQTVSGSDALADVINTANSTEKETLKNEELRVYIDGEQISEGQMIAVKEQNKSAIKDIRNKIRLNYNYTKRYEYNKEMKLYIIDYVEVEPIS